MHIPDGMLSPATSLVAAGAMLPVWTIAARQVRATLGTRQVPLLSLGAAFCFTVMMFNIPALGGTTAHPVAGTLLAILLGPWAAVIGISVALAIQALFFGDGGLLAYGANCFTMAFALPFVGYSVYRILAGRLSPASSLRAFAGGIGAYLGLNAASALVAVLLGIQPSLFHEADGRALYFPFGLHITLPAMLSTHLLVAGPVEAAVTFLVIRYMQASGQALFEEGTEVRRGLEEKRRRGERGTGKGERRTGALSGVNSPQGTYSSSPKYQTLGIGLLALVALTPLGLLAKGEAWGEWDASGVREQLQRVQGRDYVPQGIAQAEKHAYKGAGSLQDYASNEGKNKVGYAGAGLLGVLTIAGLTLLGGRLLTANSRSDKRADPDDDTSNDDTSDDVGDPPAFSGPGTPIPAPPTADRADASDANAGDNATGPTAKSGANEAASELPSWLRAPADHETLPDTTGRKPNPYIERTLGGLAHNALVTLQSEHHARQPGYLQRLDPRAKVVAFGVLIAAGASLHRAGALLGLYAFGLGLAVASRLPLGLMLRRVWLSVPFFASALALPATLNLVTPGRALLTLWTHPLVTVTRPGLLIAFVLTLRVGVTVTFAALLTLATPWNDVLRALRVLFVPRLFVSVLAMTYRYVTVLMQCGDDLFTARRSRTVGRADNRAGRRFAAASMGALWGRTLALSEEVYGAMVSRGFNGDMRTLSRFRWRMADSLWMGTVAIAALLCAGAEHVR